MKQVIVFIGSSFFSLGVFSQSGLPVLKGYAWHQPSARGAKPATVAGENGNAAARSSLFDGNLYIFLEFKKAQNILPYRVWIDGKPFRVTHEMMQSNPVIKQHPGIGLKMDTDTLVPPTGNRVMQLNPAAPITQMSLPPVKNVLTHSAIGTVVVEYYWKSRRYAYTIPQIKMLEAVRLQ